MQPFLLVDESGKCIVLPAGADINGGQQGTGLGGQERLIVGGDMIYVAGEFRPSSSESAPTLESWLPATSTTPIAPSPAMNQRAALRTSSRDALSSEELLADPAGGTSVRAVALGLGRP